MNTRYKYYIPSDVPQSNIRLSQDNLLYHFYPYQLPDIIGIRDLALWILIRGDLFYVLPIDRVFHRRNSLARIFFLSHISIEWMRGVFFLTITPHQLPPNSPQLPHDHQLHNHQPHVSCEGKSVDLVI